LKRFKERVNEFKVGPDYQEKYHKAMADLGSARGNEKKHVFIHDNSEKENEIHRSLKGLGYTHIPERGEYEKRLNTQGGGYHVVKKDTKFVNTKSVKNKFVTTLTDHTEGA